MSLCGDDLPSQCIHNEILFREIESTMHLIKNSTGNCQFLPVSATVEFQKTYGYQKGPR